MIRRSRLALLLICLILAIVIVYAIYSAKMAHYNTNSAQVAANLNNPPEQIDGMTLWESLNASVLPNGLLFAREYNYINRTSTAILIMWLEIADSPANATLRYHSFINNTKANITSFSVINKSKNTEVFETSGQVVGLSNSVNSYAIVLVEGNSFCNIDYGVAVSSTNSNVLFALPSYNSVAPLLAASGAACLGIANNYT